MLGGIAQMNIIVSIKEGQATTDKGDLLERVAKQLLESQNYNVETQIRNTGAELDLLCRAKANTTKEIYVECKAYADDKKIDSAIIKGLVGTKTLKKHSEAWLISTSNIGKDAKGLIREIEKSPESREFTFYTPELLIDALVDAKVIHSLDVAKKTALDALHDKDTMGTATLLISPLGYFWCFEELGGGNPKGLIFVRAASGNLVEEEVLLNNLAELETPFKGLNHLAILGYGMTNTKPNLGADDIKLNAEYINQIDDLGMHFNHPDKGELVLDDVFIFPDLDEVGSEESREVNSRLILDSATAPEGKCIVFGEDLSGKTSLARTLQKSLNQAGLIPIYLTAEEIKQADFEKFKSLLEKKFKKQYASDEESISVFRSAIEADGSKVPVIIDNFDSLGIQRAAAQRAFLESLQKVFTHILLFANKSIELELLAKGETKEMLDNFVIYRIRQLGHVRRDELIERWLTVEQGDSLTDSYILDRKTEISKKINTAAGINFVPTYPFYLLTMLHLFEMGNKSRLEGSSYAELYSYLVNQALLGAGVKPEDLDFYHTYMAYVAFSFFSMKIRSLTDDEMRSIFDDYLRLMDLEKPFEVVNGVLERAKLLKHDDNNYSFYLNYCHYFFTAKYLSDNIDKAEIKLTIKELVQRLYRTEYANIVIFLIHHSKNKDIIEGILQQAQSLFSDVKPYTLSREELTTINGLIHKEVRLSYRDSSPTENRKKELARRDKMEVERKRNEDDGEVDLDLFGKINFSFKIIDVLGQIANNYYGSLDGESKAAIIKELYALGLRGLHAFFGDYETYVAAIRQDLDKLIREKKIVVDKDKDKTVDRVVYTFSQLVTLVFIKRMTDSVASRNLFPTIDKVLDVESNPAAKLMNMATKLNLPNGLSANKVLVANLYKDLDKNYLSKDLLRFSVVDHMRKFDVKFAEKQSICGKLDIDFVKNQKLLLGGH